MMLHAQTDSGGMMHVPELYSRPRTVYFDVCLKLILSIVRADDDD